MEEDEEFDSEDMEIMFDLDKKDTKVWLVKLPSFVASSWGEVNDGDLLGKVRIYKQVIITQSCSGEWQTCHKSNHACQ
jgi:hypothetical protein